MAKGLSPLQRAILQVFARSPGVHEIGEVWDALPDDVLSCETPQRRVIINSLRRALYRLWERGLIMRTAQPPVNLDSGRLAFGWCLATEEARVHNFHIGAGFVVSPACPLHAVHGARADLLRPAVWIERPARPADFKAGPGRCFVVFPDLVRFAAAQAADQPDSP